MNVWQQAIANRSIRAVEIDVQDVEAWDQELANKMRMNTRRYQTLLSDAVEACLPEPDAELAERDVSLLRGSEHVESLGFDYSV